MARKKKEEKPLIVPSEIISDEEFQARVKAYDEYCEKSKETKAYKRYLKMRKLIEEFQKSHWKPGDKPTPLLKEIRKLREKCRKDLVEEKRELAKPKFEDPEIQRMKNELGVKEYWEQQIKLASEKGQEIIYLNDRVQDSLEIPTAPPTF